jgi:hypothetical protein
LSDIGEYILVAHAASDEEQAASPHEVVQRRGFGVPSLAFFCRTAASSPVAKHTCSQAFLR